MMTDNLEIDCDEIPGTIDLKDVPVAIIESGIGSLYEERGTGLRYTAMDFCRIHGYKNKAELDEVFKSHSEGGNL